jgi:serine protease Do
MTRQRGRWWATALLVAGAVAFGMVLAGSLDWTPRGWSSPPSDEGAVVLRPARGNLPGFADLAEAVSPAVVTIRAVSFQQAPEDPHEDPHGGAGDSEREPYFEYFLGPRHRGDGRQPGPQRPDRPQEFRSEAGGSGFVISSDGLIATNYHVIEGASDLMVTVGDDPRELPARVRGIDAATDLALVQVSPGRQLPHLRIGDSGKVRPGDWIMVIGNPLRLGRTVTVGVISAVGRSGLGITDVSFENFLQTDAAINFGNSGGPMVNLDGEVVGIATAINWGAENVGFAVPASTLSKVLPQLEKQGKVRRGFLGVAIENLDFRAQQAFGLPDARGALVVGVNEGTPGADGGLEHGDVILKVDGRDVGTTRDLIDYVSDRGPGTEVKLEVLRDAKRIERVITLGERPVSEEEPERREDQPGQGVSWLGVVCGDLTPALRAAHGIPENVRGAWVRSVSPHSPLIDEGVQPGDIIAEVDGRPLAGVAELEAALKTARRGTYLRFYVLRFDPRSGQAQQLFAFARVP